MSQEDTPQSNGAPLEEHKHAGGFAERRAAMRLGLAEVHQVLVGSGTAAAAARASAQQAGDEVRASQEAISRSLKLLSETQIRNMR